MACSFLLLLLISSALQAFVFGKPLNTEIFKRLADFKRSILEDPSTAALDRIIITNEAYDQTKLYEGDIALTNRDHVDTREEGDVDGPLTTHQKRNAQRSRYYLWKNKRVPYKFDSSIHESERETVRDAINTFNSYSCLKWVPVSSSDKNSVLFVKAKGCFSSVGVLYWKHGSQDLSLGDGCYHKGTIMHEMLHASGFWHEQSRSDRNQYVEVMWENIEDGKAHNFNKYPHKQLDFLGKPYDFGSIMHYGKYGFSSNGNPTLQALGNPSKEFGQRDGLSNTDMLELNILYDCKTPAGGWSSWSDYGPCDSSCHKTRQRFCTAANQTSCAGADAYGVESAKETCSPEDCEAPVNGHWGRWSSWGTCSKSCDSGTHTRTRLCDDPAQKNGGKSCEGDRQQNQACKIRSCGLGPDDCEFDADEMCGWTQDKTDSSPNPWIRNAGSTSSSNTGPSGDHTSGSGYYIYAEVSAPATTGQTARLLSKDFPATNKSRCMKFWYHMYGSGTGALNIYVKQAGGSYNKIFGKSGDQGDKWIEGHADIPPQGATYKVVLESVRGSDFLGDTALDDIKFTSGTCTASGPTTPTPVPTTLAPVDGNWGGWSAWSTCSKSCDTGSHSRTRVCNNPASQEGGKDCAGSAIETKECEIQKCILDACDFGSSAGTSCTWRNDPTNTYTNDKAYQFHWYTHSGETPSKDTGPPNGHGGSGYYLYIETSSPFQQGMTARLLSKEYKASSSMCLDFWYYMHGASVDTLSVIMENSDGKETQWANNGEQGQKWIEAKVPLSSKSDFKIIIQGKRGNSYIGDIAIDDVTVKYGACV